MTICNEIKAGYCYNACCYLLKVEVTKEEAERLGLENIVGSFLKKKNNGSCIFLDEDERKCTIYEKRPYICRNYHCSSENCLYDNNEMVVELIELKAQEIRERMIKEGRIKKFPRKRKNSIISSSHRKFRK